MIDHKHQMRTDAACWGIHAKGGVTRRFTPAAHKPHGGLHSLPVGARDICGSSPRLSQRSPFTDRSFVLRSFSIPRCARLVPSGAAPRRLGFSSRLSRHQIRARLVGARSHLRFGHHVLQDTADVPEAHSSTSFRSHVLRNGTWHQPRTKNWVTTPKRRRP